MSARVEAAAERLGFAAPQLSDALRTSRRFVRAKASGAAVGVFIGCLLGMWPLAFYDKKKVEETRLAASRKEIFAVTVQRLCEVLKTKNGCLMLVDEDRHVLYTEAEDSNSKLQATVTSISRDKGGIMGYVAATGKIVKLNDIRNSKFYDPARHDNYHGSGHSLKSVLCVPIKDAAGKIVGVIELANKAKDAEFTDADEDVAVAVASHIAPRLLTDPQDFAETISVCASNVLLRTHSRGSFQASSNSTAASPGSGASSS
jgi:signal transduction protein with GAF and PtsI domain